MSPMSRKTVFLRGCEDSDGPSSSKVTMCRPALTPVKTSVGTPMLQPRSQYPSMVWPLERSPSRSAVKEDRSASSRFSERRVRRTDEHVAEVVEAAAKVIDEDGAALADNDIEGNLGSRLVGDEILLVARPSILGPADEGTRGQEVGESARRSAQRKRGRLTQYCSWGQQSTCRCQSGGRSVSVACTRPACWG